VYTWQEAYIIYAIPSTVFFIVKSDVKHSVAQVRMNQHIFRPCLWMSSFAHLTLRWGSRWCKCIKEPTKIASSPFAHNVCIVSGRTNAHSFGGATEKVAHAMCQIFKYVGDVLERRWDLPLGKDFPLAGFNSSFFILRIPCFSAWPNLYQTFFETSYLKQFDQQKKANKVSP